MNQKTRHVVMGGLMAAVVFIATYFIQVPAPVAGNVNLGDGFIVLSGFLFGPFAAIIAAIGSALSDALGAYAVYAPATFIIKGLMGLVAGLIFFKFKKNTLVSTIVASVLCEIIMVLGYFAFELLFMKLGATAYADMIPNSVQGVAGIIIAIILVPIMKRIAPYMGFEKK